MKKALSFLLVLIIAGCSSNQVIDTNKMEEDQQLKTELDQAKNNLVNLNNSFEKLQSEHNQLKSDQSTLSAGYMELKDQILGYKGKINQLQTELSSLKNEFYDLQDENVRINNKIDNLYSDYDILRTLLPKSSEKNYIITLDSLKDLMSLQKNEVINLLGYDYVISENERDGYQYLTYWYEYYGIDILFSLYNGKETIEFIDCGSNVDLNGAKLGMTFEQIQQKLGKCEINSIEPYEPYDPTYAMMYTFDNYRIWFASNGKDEPVSNMQIRRVWE